METPPLPPPSPKVPSYCEAPDPITSYLYSSPTEETAYAFREDSTLKQYSIGFKSFQFCDRTIILTINQKPSIYCDGQFFYSIDDLISKVTKNQTKNKEWDKLIEIMKQHLK